MAIFVSDIFADSAKACSVNVSQLAKMFNWWKADPARINQSMWFGRDTAYDEPQLQGRGRLLRHCHLLPLIDEEAWERWLRVFKMKGEKTSDKALVYAEHGGDYVLLYILDEPGAHERARKEKKTMTALYRRAIAFSDGDLALCKAA